MARNILNIGCLVVLLGTLAYSQQTAEPASAMATAAIKFLDSLNDEQQAAARFAFDSDDRFDWHFIPRERKGVPLKTMTSSQRSAALDLVRTGLSEDRIHEDGGNSPARTDSVRTRGTRHPRPGPVLLHGVR